MNNLIHYLKGRGISKETAQDFNLMLCKKRVNYLGEKVNCNKYLKYTHRNSIVFPIQMVYGNVVAISSKNPVKSKYLHSGKKTYTLYGIYTTWKEILNKGYAIIVEGNFDILQCYENGLRNVVSLLGSKMTKYQASLLRRFTNKCVLALDGDSAGKRTQRKLLKMLKELDFNCRVIDFPKGDDPDSFLEKYTKKEFLQLIKK